MNVSASIRKLTQLFIVLFIALSGGLVYWQVVVAQQVTTNIHNSRHCLPDNAPIRGRIFDRNGVLLADSRPSSTICGYQRHYYLKDYPSLAGLLGYYISPLYSSSGIEHQYDDYLSGRIGLTALNNTVNRTLHRPPVGDDIYLTIDVRMQRLVDHYFDAAAPAPDGVNVFQTDRGSVIISNPHTGEVLAMLSRPTFDSNRIASGDLKYFQSLEQNPEHPLLERPIQSAYVPGSTYKTMTLLAGLDSGNAHLDDPFYNDTHGQPQRFNPNHPQAIGPVIIGSGEQTEIFGPVLSLVHADSLEDAIRILGASEYGNAASLFTSNGSTARRFKYAAPAGNIGINVGVAAPIAYFPFSGWKASFFGDLHAQGRDGVEFYTEKKVVVERWA